VLLGRNYQIDDIELDAHELRAIPHREVEPLRVPAGVYVILENQIILVRGHLRYLPATWYTAKRFIDYP
jgi:hypothetical protein